MELVISIALNLALGLVLLALLWSRRHDARRLSNEAEAEALFRAHFPAAAGVATLSADGRGALIELPRGIGVLVRAGRRWNARLIMPRELVHAQQDSSDAISLTFADFGWPRVRLSIADADVRAGWLARLQTLRKPHA
jgi:hypothetical protein